MSSFTGINQDVSSLSASLVSLLEQMDEQQSELAYLLEGIHPTQKSSALNLLNYLCVRSSDRSSLQKMLHLNGLSTLTGAEAYVKSQLTAINRHLGIDHYNNSSGDYFSSRELLNRRVRRVFGDDLNQATPAIMVTFKTSFAYDFIMVKKLLKAGMNVARINCAHDDEKVWFQMIKTVKESSAFTGIPCKIYMDLAGPKLRTRIRNKKNRLEIEEEDRFVLTPTRDFKSKLPVVECDIPGLSHRLKTGERVLFDDGVIETRVTGIQDDGVELEVTRVSSKKPLLKAEKGINFPDSKLQLPAVSEFDLQCIPFIKKHADIVGLSFINQEKDIDELWQLLSDSNIPLVLKIETPDAWNNLPSLLFTAMKQPVYAVMIARGDLAVEIGFENISNAQDEVISLCRAAHAPVIYATQVLESMNKKGIPTRAEITDAAYGISADCVMLNKGAHTARAVKILKSILLDKSKQIVGNHPAFGPMPAATNFFKNHQPNKTVLTTDE